MLRKFEAMKRYTIVDGELKDHEYGELVRYEDLPQPYQELYYDQWIIQYHRHLPEEINRLEKELEKYRNDKYLKELEQTIIRMSMKD